ncbi:MAG: hypothetical protein KME10_06110 [Plectolyngbya sp. WJT66-NPBG17]|jgi:hypothetical protein|nr:hypothetical protein [Plectolyngbya sp. WJT66-NPBG17]MBW4526989.1 hypothetical protein [Phormidium tanganyikae FI6-MK23]
MAGLRASEAGKLQIRQAIQARNWNITGEEPLKMTSQLLGSPPGIYANGVSETTWKRFVYAKRAIRRDTFEAYCNILGLDWTAIAELSEPQASRDDLSLMRLIPTFYGRTQELCDLKALLLNYRFVILYGLGGIGKTAVAVQLVEQVQTQFDRRIWRRFDHTLPIAQLLLDLLHTLSSSPQSFPSDPAMLVQLLLQDLGNSRTLIVLDEVNSGESNPANYQHFIYTLQELGQRQNQSCILLTTRERPADFTALMGGQAISYPLQGLDPESGCNILAHRQLIFEPAIGQQLVQKYRGNPLALELLCPIVRDLFQNQVESFLQNPGIYVPGRIEQVLRQQIQDLTEFEQLILRSLAHSDPLSRSELQDELNTGDFIQALYRLGRRSLIENVIENDDVLYTLQPMVMEFVRKHRL